MASHDDFRANKPGSLWSRNLSADFKSNFGTLAAWVYGLQALVVVPWFLGAMYRGEQSIWVWKEYARDVAQHSQGDADLLVYLYVVFYASFFLFPYCGLELRYTKDEFDDRRSSRKRRILVSTWFAATLLLFGRPIFAFIRAIPTDIWNGWLIVLWLASAGAVAFWIAAFERRRAFARER